MKNKRNRWILAALLLAALLITVIILTVSGHRGENTETASPEIAEEVTETATPAPAAGESGGKTETSAPRRSEVGYYLNTVITLTAFVEDPQVLKDALAECGRYEALLSRTAEGSDVWRVNHAGGQPVEVSDDTIVILRCAMAVSEASGGAFDVTIAPVSTIWDFTSGAAVLPDAEALAAAAELVDWTKISVDGNTVTLPAGMMIDLGGIAKGYIADRIKQYLKDKGVEHAILSFGGNVIAIGVKPDGSDWKVGVQDIDRPTGETMMVLRNSGGSTVTSGTYERGFDLDGVRYHHLLDPATGWPVQNGLASVTILCDSSMIGDALSTAVFVLGPEEGLALVESLQGTEAILITNSRDVILSSGAEEYIIQ